MKVLDFGLAKIASVAAAIDLTAVPTITAGGTREGMVVGTAAYMSPEQARGQAVDKRTDIWAFGCVLYEMLTGQRAFPGTGFAETLGAIVHGEPAWNAVPPDLPPVLGRFLRQCLQKAPAQRLRDAGDLRLALEGAFEPPAAVRSPRARAMIPGMAAGLALTAIASGVIVWSLRPAENRSVGRFSHTLPGDQSFTSGVRPLVAIAPDGASIVYVASNRLYLRAMNDLDTVPIRGTDGWPSAPFFSPDGQFVGYWDSAAEELRTVAISGGTPVTLAAATSFYSGSWGLDDAIVYGQENGTWRVPASGGKPELLVRIEPGERVHGPRMLPDGRTVLFSLVTVASMVGQSTAWDAAEVIAQSLETGERTTLVRGSDAQYVSTGHLVYALDTALLAVPFDLASRRIGGRPVPIVEGIQRANRTGGSSGSANYDVSQAGTLVYVPGGERSTVRRRLLAIDAKGNSAPLLDDLMDYWRPRISPDGGRVVVEVLGAGGNSTQLWIVDLERKTATPLNVEGSENSFPVWTPDGQSVIYRSNQRGMLGIYRQAADGSGEAELLLKMETEFVPTAASRDGVLAFSVGPQTGERSIRMLRLADKSVSEFLETPAWEHMPMFSPDGKWVAYASNESGEFEVYVRPYPRSPGIARRVSVGGGTGPVWSPDGGTVYYRGASGDLMAAPTTLRPFTVGRPRPLFRFAGTFRDSGNTSAYDIHPDARRFIMVSEPETPVAPRRQINIVQNWTQELKRLVPAN